MTMPAGVAPDMQQPGQGRADPILSILIVAYNASGFIADCIGSVIAHTLPGQYEILLIDNGTDRTAEKVAAEFPEVRIIPSRGNIGFGPANNVLAQHARGRFLLLLNPDTKLVDPAIDRLLAFAQTQPAGAWGGLTTLPDGSLDGGNFLAIPTIGGIVKNIVGLGGPVTHRAALEQLSTPKRVEVLSGGFMLISREAWDAVGGFDPSFLLYSEEIDLFTRLRAANFEVWMTPESRIIHDVGGGILYSAARMRHAHTGLMHYARCHWRSPVVQLVGLAYWVTAARRWLTSVLLSPLSAAHRSRRRAFTPILINPGRWWRGYEGRATLD
jgi:N-acetylglucosaminyl-diphospho-decaprenol L-rhamnosyltransferase